MKAQKLFEEILKESSLFEMVADEKKRRIQALQDQLATITDELRNIDSRDITRRQQVTNRRFEIRKQLETLRRIETS